MRLTAAISEDSGWFVARCLEVEVTSQGESLEEARRNLVEALELYFEDESEIVVNAEVTRRPFIQRRQNQMVVG